MKHQHYFAPGVVETYRADQVETWSRAILVVLALVALAAALGLACGWLDVRGWPL